MSRSASSRALALVLATGCGGGSAPVLALCARGDRADLAAQVASLELRFVDDGGAALGAPVELAASDTHFDPPLPTGAARVSATGFDAGGAPIALGEAAITADGGCVCFALDGQVRAACEAVTCALVDDACRFADAQGMPLASQTLGFGEGGDLTGVTIDTYLEEDEATVAHDEATIEAGPNPNRVALVRFDLSAMPTTAVIERAALALHVCAAADCSSSHSLELHPVLEAWSEAATWDQRLPGTAWKAIGCGSPASCAAASLGTVSGSTVNAPVTSDLDVTTVTGWVADPTTNFGLALVPISTSGTALHLDSSEAAAPADAPRLDLTYHLE